MNISTHDEQAIRLREAFTRALDAHRRDDVAAAGDAYAEALRIDPQHVDSLHMLGMLHHQQADAARAFALLNEALRIAPAQPAILANRASVHLAAANHADAERDAYQAALLDPESFGAWFNLGLARKGLADPAATSAFARASALRPTHARALLAWFSAAAVFSQVQGISKRVRSPLPELTADRSLALRTALELEQHGMAGPAFAVLSQLRRELPGDDEVRERHALETRYGAAALLEHRGQTNEALVEADALLRIAPWHRGARILRASIAGGRGEAQAALADYRHVVESVPDDPFAGSAYLIAMQHDPVQTADAIAAAHRDWARRHVSSVRDAPPRPHADADRPLRIGWLSPRFFPGLLSGFFLAPLRKFERFSMTQVLYDSGGVEAQDSADWRAAADEWRRVDDLDDSDLCAQIRADRIDVLVQLSGHSPGNRLHVLARRPAPVQVHWLDYFHSTGTQAVDVLISDALLSPANLARHYSERVVHLRSGRLCYSPPPNAPSVPPRSTDRLRLASFNRVDKLNDDVLSTWSRILRALPGSVLRIKVRSFEHADERAYFIARCARHGIARERLELQGYGTHVEALAAYSDVDIALDPFPFSGCATSLDALWMGVPVITAIGDTMVSRQSASLLTSLRLPELIVDSSDSYVRCVVALANDAPRRAQLRAGLRERVRAELCDVERHALELAAALRESWRKWCQVESNRSQPV
ncbi:MAG: hypothetical protein ABI846_00455 [Rudaea sp.]